MEQYEFVSRKVAADLITGFPIIELNLTLMDSFKELTMAYF